VLVVRGLATQRLPVARYRRGTRSIAAEELDKVSTNDVARIEAESRQIRAERKLDSQLAVGQPDRTRKRLEQQL